MDGSSILLVFVLIIGVALGVNIWLTIIAKREYETVTSLSLPRLRALVDDSFGKLLWEEIDGPGDLNFRRRSVTGRGATISIAFETTADNKIAVEAWMSAWTSRYGLVVSSGWWMSKKIIRKIDQAV